MKQPGFLGIDVGTTNIKACLFCPGFDVVSTSRRTPVSKTPDKNEFHDAEALWQTVAGTIRDCIERAEQVLGAEPAVRSVGVASMAEEFVCLNADGDAIGPVIPWYDNRPANQLEHVLNYIDREALRMQTGLPLDKTFSLLKFLWLAEFEPDLLAKTRQWLPISDYINYRLCGNIAVNPSLASRTMLYNPFENRWIDDFVSEFGLSHLSFPTLAPGGFALGTVRAEVAAVTGLTTDVVVGMGGHDDACAALGAGVFEPGSGIVSAGTAEAVFAPIHEARAVESPSVCIGRHVTGESLYMTDYVSTGALARWTVENLSGGRSVSRTDVFDHIAQAVTRTSTNIQFSVTRSPISLQSFGFHQVDLNHDIDDLLHAALTEVSNDLKRTVQQIQANLDIPLRSWLFCGGLAEIPAYTRWKQQFFDEPLVVQHFTELSAGGAAVSAAAAAGAFSSMQAAQQFLIAEPVATTFAQS